MEEVLPFISPAAIDASSPGTSSEAPTTSAPCTAWYARTTSATLDGEEDGDLPLLVAAAVDAPVVDVLIPSPAHTRAKPTTASRRRSNEWPIWPSPTLPESMRQLASSSPHDLAMRGRSDLRGFIPPSGVAALLRTAATLRGSSRLVMCDSRRAFARGHSIMRMRSRYASSAGTRRFAIVTRSRCVAAMQSRHPIASPYVVTPIGTPGVALLAPGTVASTNTLCGSFALATTHLSTAANGASKTPEKSLRSPKKSPMNKYSEVAVSARSLCAEANSRSNGWYLRASLST
mmetsp:Transcript_7255/g.18808  ORF Transcript_7255/g.18808 Transcript_7255/m.18808 type:complete len:289 (-) Transcript_7255:470-1336(-)